MPRVCVLVPFAFDEKGLANRRAQQESVRLSPDVELDFKPVKAGPALYDSYHDYVLADFAMLGHKFSVLTQWDGWIALYHKGAREYGLEDHLVSVRSINTPPDVENLLGGKEDVVFPKLRDAGLQCVQDGADVICLGSTTMHQAHAYLAENLPVPVINPGPLTYKLAETMLSLGLSQSRQAYPQPNVEKRAMIQAMAQAAADSEKAPA